MVESFVKSFRLSVWHVTNHVSPDLFEHHISVWARAIGSIYVAMPSCCATNLQSPTATARNSRTVKSFVFSIIKVCCPDHFNWVRRKQQLRRSKQSATRLQP
jgi:hypothetical protein